MMLGLIFLVVGGIPLLAVVALLSIAAVTEFYNVFKTMGIKVNRFSGYACVVLLFVITALDKFVGISTPASQSLMMLWLGVTIFAGFCCTLWGKEHDIMAGIATSLGVIYPAFGLVHVVYVNRIDGFASFVWLIFLAAYGSDTGCYFAGTLLGKHKLCPELSPKKTVEGALGGVVLGTVLCFLFGLFFGKGNTINCLFIGLFGSIVSQMGDISASTFKRKAGVKDYSNLIPGHGGIMDRFDSIIFTAPFVYYYMTLFVK